MKSILAIILVVFILAISSLNVFGLDVLGVKTAHDVGTYYNDSGDTYKASYLDTYKYKDFEITNILRGNYAKFLKEQNFSTFKSAAGYSLEEFGHLLGINLDKVSVVYQYQGDNTNDIRTAESRQGLSYKFTNKWKSLSLINNLVWFPLESKSDHQIRLVTEGHYMGKREGKDSQGERIWLTLTNMWNVDIDIVGGFEQEMLTNLCYWYQENVGLSIEIQRQTGTDMIIRFGTRFKF